MKFLNLALTFILSTITLIDCNFKFILKFISNGAKSPIYLDQSQNDLFKENWNFGTGVLTPVGYRMLYVLGTKDRETYKNFISTDYKSSDFYIRAGAVNTTLMSANAYLQGLYPPSTGPSLSPTQRTRAYPAVLKNFGGFDSDNFGDPALPRLTQVFPIQSFDDLEKQYFFFSFATCGPIEDNFNSNEKQKKVKDWLVNFRDTYGSKLLKVLTLSDVDDFLDYELVYKICSTYVADYIDGKVLKSFTDNGIGLEEFNKTSTEFLFMDLYDVKNGFTTNGMLSNATMAAFKDETLFWMENRINGTTYKGYPEYNAPKFVLFSVSDITISSLLAYFAKEKGLDILAVPYASSLTFELRTKIDKSGNSVDYADYEVDIMYNGKLLKTFSYLEFKNSLENAWTVEKLRRECANNLAEKYGYKNATIVLGVLVGVTFVIFLITIICCCKDRNKGIIEEDYERPKNAVDDNRVVDNQDQPQQE